MLQVKLDTGFNIEVDFAIAPFHKRIFAWAIDIVILYVYSQLLYFMLNSLTEDDYHLPDWAKVLLSLPWLVYFLLSEVFWNGQSVGKKAMNIKVISADGGSPSISQYLIRWVFRLLDFPITVIAAVIFGALPGWCIIFAFGGLASILFSSHSQRLGDLAAGTMLIDTRNRTSWEDTVFTEISDTYQPRFPQVMQLSDKDINTLKSIIETVRRKSDYDLSMRIGDRIKSKLGIASDQNSLEFLETLLTDYNYYATN